MPSVPTRTVDQCCEALELAYNEVTFKRALLDLLDALNYEHTLYVNANYPLAPVVYSREASMTVRGEEFEITLKNGVPIEKEE